MVLARLPIEMWSKDVAALILMAAAWVWWWRKGGVAAALFGIACFLRVAVGGAISFLMWERSVEGSFMCVKALRTVSVGVLSVHIVANMIGAAAAVIVILGFLRNRSGRPSDPTAGDESRVHSDQHSRGA